MSLLVDFCYCANPLDTQHALKARTEQHAERLFKIIDINGDGNLTETECLRVRICFDKVWFVVLGAVHKLCQPKMGGPDLPFPFVSHCQHFPNPPSPLRQPCQQLPNPPPFAD